MTCHQSGHIPPLLNPEEDGPSLLLFVTPPPAESLGNQVGRLTFIFLSSWGLESHYDVAQRMPLSSALRFLSVWSGPMALAGSRPVDVCLQTIYGLNSGVFLSTLLHMPYPNQGVVWRSVQSVFTRLLPRLLLVFLFPRICASVCQPDTEVWTVFPPRRDANRLRMRPESPFTCSYIGSSLDQYLSTDSSV